MTSYLKSVNALFRYYKTLGEKAMDQVAEPDLFKQYNEESNSVAIIVNHLAGNMLSRFTDFLSTDGEKPWRDRDGEFENRLTNRAELLAHWEKGWACVFAALDPLTENDMERVVYIRNEGHTVAEALNRQLAHYASHVGQIIFIAKMAKGSEWKSLSIPRHKSDDYNQEKFSNPKEKRHFTDGL